MSRGIWIWLYSEIFSHWRKGRRGTVGWGSEHKLTYQRATHPGHLGVLLAVLPLAQRCELYLLGKAIGRWEIAVVLDEHATDHKHGMVRRGNRRRSLRPGPFPAGAAHEVVARLGARGAFADVGKI